MKQDSTSIQAAAKQQPPASIQHEMLGKMRVPTALDVQAAAKAIAPYVRHTPLLRNAALDSLTGGRIWLKAENLQVTGSFKARGAFNALLSLTPEQRQRGVVAYSTGNHGQAIAWAAKQLGIPATIVMPTDAPKAKIRRALAHGAKVVHYDRTKESRETIGMRLLEETGGTLVPPGDNPYVLAAQGTVALEALQDLPPEARTNLELFAAPCGGGGLMAGCSLVTTELSPNTRLVAVEPEHYDDTVRSLSSGQREQNAGHAATLCDALQAVTPAELPFSINGKLLNGACAVSDEDVLHAMRFALDELKLVLEPGGSVALAALLRGDFDVKGRDAVIVLSGGNVDAHVLRQAIGEEV